ncbi:hypothetical protein [uncultured Methanobrevibacter sp.]|uniref:hypothetical protein n=1 Tax=uncultured Methanobrevibacter sp. TaxID=253161 RepID=UPI002610A473|nr:hypothetical protein [uncultured Methanobrevibacter sp.]
MSEFKISDVNDNTLKERLKEQALVLGISENDLIDKLICLGLKHLIDKKRFSSKHLSHDEIRCMLKKDKDNDFLNGVVYNQGDIQILINLVSSA